VRDILLYGLCGGVLIAVLKLTEYRFLVVEHSVEIYGALVAALFAGLGIWLVRPGFCGKRCATLVICGAETSGLCDARAVPRSPRILADCPCSSTDR
jgi:hypothetical protein